MPTKYADMTKEQKQNRLKYQRKYRANRTEEQRERIRDYKRDWLANRTEEQRERERDYKRDWYSNMTEEQEERLHKRNAVRASRDRAKQKGVPFNLTIDHINEIWPPDNKCPVLGVPFVRGRGEPIPTSPTFDRIEPAEGYTIGNVQVISRRANLIKSDATAAEVMIVAQYLIKEERERASI